MTNLQMFIDQCLNDCSVKLDVIRFSETRLANDLVPLYDNLGYNL